MVCSYETMNQNLIVMDQSSQPSPELEVVSNAPGAKDSNRPKKRKIRFNRRVYVIETIHVNDMTDDEIERSWYQREEFSQIKKDYGVTVQLMMQKLPIPDDQTTRGLEARHPVGSRNRQLNKLDGLSAVLDEQERQIMLDIDDEDSLSRVYKRVSVPCLQAARLLALRDLSAVRREPEMLKQQDTKSRGKNANRSSCKQIPSPKSSKKKQGVLRRMFAPTNEV